MQPGDVQLIIRRNVLWGRGLSGRLRESCLWAAHSRSISNDFFAIISKQPDASISPGANFPNIRLAWK
jgi:hypothetical protein